MFVSDIDVLLEILYRSDLGDISDEILKRSETVFAEEKFLSLDLSNLGIVEIPEVIYLMNKLEKLDLRNNKIADLPYEILLLDKCAILLEGNPLGSLKQIGPRLQSELEEMNGVPRVEQLDETIYHSDNKLMDDSVNLYFKDKICGWCNRTVGYRKEESRVDTKWGRSTQVFTSLICANCSHVELFYGDNIPLTL